MRKHRESTFIREARDLIRLADPRSFFYKIPDSFPTASMEVRFIPKKPFDIVCCIDARFFAIEAKTASGPSWRPDTVSQHQEDSLALVSIAGGMSLIILKFMNSDRYYITMKGLREIKRKMENEGRKSIKESELAVLPGSLAGKLKDLFTPKPELF